MSASVRVEGKLFEVSGEKGAVLPFGVAEVSKRRVFVINLQMDEFRWLVREMVRFCPSKGEPLWVRTFRDSNHCLLLQLRKNKRGRYIVLSQLSYSGSQELLFSRADGWFGVTKLLKETLIGASSSNFAKSKEASKAAGGFSSKPMSYANVVRGATSAVLAGQLKGWRCRSCGSWDVYASVLGDERVSTPLASKQKEHEQGMPSRTSGKDLRRQNMVVSYYKVDGSCVSPFPRVKATGEGSPLSRRGWVFPRLVPINFRPREISWRTTQILSLACHFLRQRVTNLLCQIRLPVMCRCKVLQLKIMLGIGLCTLIGRMSRKRTPLLL